MIQVIRHEDGSETRSRSVNAVTGETSWPVTSREASYLVLGAESKAAAFAAILDEAPLEQSNDSSGSLSSSLEIVPPSASSGSS